MAGFVWCQRPQGCKDGINCDVAKQCLWVVLQYMIGQAERDDYNHTAPQPAATMSAPHATITDNAQT